MDPGTVVVDWMRDHGTNEDVAFAEGRKRRSRPLADTYCHLYVIQVLVNDGNLRTKNEEETSKYLLDLLQLADFLLLQYKQAAFDARLQVSWP